MPNYWLMKSEPDVYSIDDLEREGSTPWEGVRNYQARNYMQSMHKGDLAFFYHSNADPPGVAGIGKVVRQAYPDPTAFDPESKYYDPKTSPDNPRWFRVDLGFVERFPHLVSLAELKAHPALTEMVVTRKGSRLSVQPVTEAEWKVVRALGRGRKS